MAGGCFWSAAGIAALLMSTSVAAAPLGHGKPLLDQLEIWTDREGQQFLVAFAAVQATSSITIDRDRAELIDRARIAAMLHETTLVNTWRVGEWRGDDPLGRGRLHAVAVAWTSGTKAQSSWIAKTLAQSHQWLTRLSSPPQGAPAAGTGESR